MKSESYRVYIAPTQLLGAFPCALVSTVPIRVVLGEAVGIMVFLAMDAAQEGVRNQEE